MLKVPKRNKSKDNPYKLGYDEIEKKYIVEFVDNKKIINKVEVSEEVYKAFDSFELEDISQIHKYRAHIEHNEVFPYKIVDDKFSVEETVDNMLIIEELKVAMNLLTETQKRRIKLYYIEDMTLEQIAELENASAKNVWKSINQAINKLKKLLKK